MKRALFLLFVLGSSSSADAEWQIKPFAGIKFGGGTAYVADLERAGGKVKPVVGVSVLALGNIFGVEADLSRIPGFFQNGPINLVSKSSVTTATGNVVAALPRRATQYTLRPYVVGGFGLIHANTSTFGGVFALSRTVGAADVGAGATGFITERTGVSWDLRYFRKVYGNNKILTVENQPERVSFWRVSMGVAFRY